jgi:predicted transcriptional regulator
LVITFRISKYPAVTFGDYIRKWRLEQGLFQRDLAKVIGVDEMTIVNWETGKTKPAKNNLERIKNFCTNLIPLDQKTRMQNEVSDFETTLF